MTTGFSLSNRASNREIVVDFDVGRIADVIAELSKDFQIAWKLRGCSLNLGGKRNSTI